MLLTLQSAQQLESKPQEVPPDPGAFKIDVAVDQVFLSVNARSRDGGFVTGLEREDFQILEDGVPQEILNFAQEAVPVKVVLVIDVSGSTAYTQASIRRAALHFAKSLESEDEVAIITFNYEPKLILNWTNDLERIELALQSIYAKGQTVLNDALYVTFDDLLKDVSGKKAVILLTDGVDTGSMMTFAEAVELAVRSEAMVYVASKLDEYWQGAIAQRHKYTMAGQFIPKELTDEYIIDVRRSLQRLTDLTGGRVINAQAFSSLTEVYAQVAEELKNQYYLSYVPSNRSRDGKWREVEIRPRRLGMVLSTRRGYYAPLDIATSP